MGSLEEPQHSEFYFTGGKAAVFPWIFGFTADKDAAKIPLNTAEASGNVKRVGVNHMKTIDWIVSGLHLDQVD